MLAVKGKENCPFSLCEAVEGDLYIACAGVVILTLRVDHLRITSGLTLRLRERRAGALDHLFKRSSIREDPGSGLASFGDKN